jgi:tetratricopeptide (TPR) repeat protein
VGPAEEHLVLKSEFWTLLLVFFCSLTIVWGQDSPQTVEEHYGRAQQAMAENDYKRAAAEWKAIVSLKPNLAEAHSNLGIAYHLQDQFEPAIQEFEAALQLNPNLLSAALFLGIDNYLISRPECALGYLKRAQALQPHDPLVCKWLGMTLFQTGDLSAAATELRACLRRDSSDDELLFHLGRVYLAISLEAHESLRRVAPESSWLHLLAAEGRIQRAQLREAVAEFRQLLQIDPVFPDAHYRLGKLLEEMNQFEAAEREYSQQLLANACHPEAAFRLTQLLANRRQIREAGELRQAAKARCSGSPGVLRSLAVVRFESPLMTEGDPQQNETEMVRDFLKRYTEEAKSSLAMRLTWDQKSRDAVAQHDPDGVLRLLTQAGQSPAVQYWKGRALLEKGNLKETTDIFLALTRKYPDNPEYLYYLGLAAQKLSFAMLEDFTKRVPDSYRCHQLLAEYYVAAQNEPKAIEEYHRALTLEPAANELHLALGNIYWKQHESDAAVAEYEAELRNDRYSTAALISLGEIYASRHEDIATRYFLRALEIQPNNVRARVKLAGAFIANKDFQKALGQLEEAQRIAPANEDVIYNLMLVYRNLGRTADARRAMEKFRATKRRTSETGSTVREEKLGHIQSATSGSDR